MKEILEKILDKKIELIEFKQDIDVYPKQYKDVVLRREVLSSYTSSNPVLTTKK
jgi:hypothetical protein